MVRSPYRVHAVTDGFWGERPPRGYSRTDRVELNLFDAGHGDQIQARNPILLGLGVTLRLRLNRAVKTWRVFIRQAGDSEIEITPQFKRVAPGMLELRGVLGAGAFNPSDNGPGDWDEATLLEIRVVTRNVTLESTFRASLWVRNDDDFRTCPDPCINDFPMLRALREQHVRVWRDNIQPTRQPADTEESALFFLFDQAEHLKNLSAAICACLNYHELVHAGVEFFVVGTCVQASFANYPRQAGCNPWDETVPEIFGSPVILPDGWEGSGCP